MRYIQRALLLVVVAVTAVVGAFAQTIKGTVVDNQTREPIIGATVALTGEKVSGTITDFDGNFQLQVKELPAVIVVGFTGYRNQEIDVYDVDEPVEVELVESHSFIEQVVVVGYGVQKRQQLTASISSIKEEFLSFFRFSGPW